MQTMPRESWTDERLDEFSKRMDERFDRSDERIAEVRREMKDGFAQVDGRFELVDKDELFSNNPALEDHRDSIYGSTFRIGGYTFRPHARDRSVSARRNRAAANVLVPFKAQGRTANPPWRTPASCTPSSTEASGSRWIPRRMPTN